MTGREGIIQVCYPGLGIAVGVINGGELYLELCDARVLKRINDLGQIRHRGAHLHVSRLIQGIKRVTSLPQIIRIQMAKTGRVQLSVYLSSCLKGLMHDE